MVVAQIAYNHLDPAVKSRCDALIAVPLTFAGSGSSNFVTAASWADDFKSQLGTGGWHYIDLTLHLDGLTNEAANPPQSNVVYAINLCLTNLLNPATSQSNQAVFLRYLLHFVGDIQQPLHCSDAVSTNHPTGDAGGNFFSVTGWSSLHSLWDSGGGYLNDPSMSRPLNSTGQTTLSNKVAAVEADYPFTPNPGSIPNPMDWAQEGLGLAQTVSYTGITENTSPSSAYLANAQATSEQRMAAGGHRLADLLNTIFGTNAMSLTSCTLSNGTFLFSWSAIPGRNYRVQWKQNLPDSTWTDLTNITASTTSLTLTDQVAGVQRFYRVAQ
jgi:hypothetical protein